MLKNSVVLIYDNSTLLIKHNLSGSLAGAYFTSPYSFKFASSDFHQFLNLKIFLGGKKFNNNDDVGQRPVLSTQAVSFHEEDIQKLVSHQAIVSKSVIALWKIVYVL